VIVLSSLRLRFCGSHFQVMAALMRLMWPRFQQSAALIITNYQILSGLPDRIGIPFPENITVLLKNMQLLVNVDILNLPGLSCIVGSSFYRKFLANMLAPLFIILVTWGLSKRHLRKLRSVTMPMPTNLDQDLDSIGPVGSEARRRQLRRRVNFKVSRAIVASKIQAPYYGFICFIVYLRFPAASRIIFEMFICRQTGPPPGSDCDMEMEECDDIRYLEADYREKCFEGAHETFAYIAAFFMFAYILMIPLAFYIVLEKNKITICGKAASTDYAPGKGEKGEAGYTAQVGSAAIPGNQDFVKVAPYKPL
jgi:hypothetical protein